MISKCVLPALIVWTIALSGVSCNRSTPGWSQAQLDSFFVKVDAMNDRFGSKNETKFVDSVYRTLAVVNDRMLFARYSRAVTNRFSWGANEESIRYSDSAVAIVNRHADDPDWDEEYVNAYTSRGSVYFGLGRTDDALESYFLARERARRIVCGPASDPDHYIGLALYKQRKFASAATFFKSAVATLDRCPKNAAANANQKCELLNDISLCYREVHRFDSAKWYANNALMFLDTVRNNGWFKGDTGIANRRYAVKRAVVRGGLAKLYELEGQTDSAERLYRESIHATQAHHKERAFVQATQADLAGLYLNQRQPAKARPVLAGLRAGLDSLPDQGAQLNWLRLESRRLEQEGQAGPALRLTQRYYALRDSLHGVAKENTLSSLTDGLRRKSQGLEISLLKKTNTLTRIYLLVAAMLIAFAFIYLLMLLRNNRRTRRNMLQLQRLNEQINRQKTALEQANRDKERLMQVVAHDLRNPVGVASYAADSLLLGGGLDETSRKSLGRVQQATANALTIINDLLGMESLVNEATQQIDLADFMRSEVELLGHKIREKTLVVSLYAEQENVYITAGPARLSRVFSNVLMNAIKFSPAGAAVRVTIATAGSHAVVTIEDEGIGMPASMLETANAPVVRRTGTAGEPSFGMGLEIAATILAAYSGNLRFERGQSGGTRVIVSMPLKQ